MKIEFDQKKSEKNRLERGLPFERMSEFNWGTAYYEEDTRRPYPEQRFIATGYLGARIHVSCFTYVEKGIRIISFRKANFREVKKYEKKKQIQAQGITAINR